MRIELTRVGLLVKLANHYTSKGALSEVEVVANFTPVQAVHDRALVKDRISNVDFQRRKLGLQNPT